MTTKTHTLQLNIEKRDTFGKKLKEARKQGKLPVVLYGSGKKTTSYFTELSAFKKTWKEAGESSVIELIENNKKIADVLVHDIAREPVRGEFLHIDFYAVDMTKTIEASIPLMFVGVAPAEKDLGGVLVKVMHEIEIEALPADLPRELRVDISKLTAFGDKIAVKDLKLPAGVKILAKADEIVALVEEHKEEVVEEKPAEIDMSKIEVEKKGKKEEETSEDEEAPKK